MNICDELREIKERLSLKAIKMTFEEQKAFYRKGAETLQKEIDDLRKRDYEISVLSKKKKLVKE